MPEIHNISPELTLGMKGLISDICCNCDIVFIAGVQGALLSCLVEPVYVSSIILGKLFHPGHLSRAVSMRVELDNDNSFSNQLPSSYHVNHPKLEPGYLVQQVRCWFSFCS